MNKSILVCGVGGQGTVLASKIIAAAAMKEGEIVHSAETIGMAQRGGSVTSHLRIGDEAFSPLIPFGKAHMILAFEPGEAVRNLKYLRKDGLVIVNSNTVKPVTESLRETGYDGTEMIEYLRQKCSRVIEVSVEELGEKLGSRKCFNVSLLGIAWGTGLLEISEEKIKDEIRLQVPERFLELNMNAFNMGVQLSGNC